MPEGVLEVPGRAKPVLMWLGELTQDELDQILAVLTQEEIGSVYDTAAAVESVTAEGPTQRGRQLMSMLLSLYSLQFSTDWTAENIASNVVGEESLNYDGETQSRLRGWLTKALSSFSMERLSKAYDVATEYEKLFEGARVITEARPVFSAGDDIDVYGIVITHSLKLEYVDRRGHNELYVALNDTDLETLQRAIMRARKKGERLSRALASADLTDLTFVLDSGERHGDDRS